MADKYELLAQILQDKVGMYLGADAEPWISVCVGVLRDLHDHENGELPTSELPDAIYGRIASGEGQDFDADADELKPGEYDPESGEYNPADAPVTPIKGRAEAGLS